MKKIILFIILISFSSGCGDYISNEEVEQCQEACRFFGGLGYIKACWGFDYSYNADDLAICKNGNIIKMSYKEKQ